LVPSLPAPLPLGFEPAVDGAPPPSLHFLADLVVRPAAAGQQAFGGQVFVRRDGLPAARAAALPPPRVLGPAGPLRGGGRPRHSQQPEDAVGQPADPPLAAAGLVRGVPLPVEDLGFGNDPLDAVLIAGAVEEIHPVAPASEGDDVPPAASCADELMGFWPGS